ncbi:co-chaperone GroES [Candidatus Berkelbacteria bacterium CG_4_9_14_3_um_filter_39_23]|uniref:Co-chaperonin GroES n=2 Tax=Candidatus Berkelbacteria TaxID=1618330 RepID=A0A2M7CHV6_9BACT|nr:co-chaperone GroES [Candidatus Berkelbacteria bacterium]OIP05909.1 MAG: co-chaperone GroES [Candidatus Berkelbacteria bacterium CG2_30_39_44]PIR27684.1 MAG: co-chaperone GroES [Candidatus Berkelbacteria bacterium CG11_big_fil_rev_8_21_14_0_20_40_23]PIV25236.1 MAG: co-chaperone GroES [Candidatus Berkelbacteria bacterium CG03_land_8_20_14_0_80_40_36]PIX30782.1 MAG: co-chaperone GroES [Candidatus Berkelbacteria bacterium CG_4_8_14_3_um_filter_39_27]PIZ29006.1 MAG: co-chaperone GroES [Candidatu
MLDIKPLGDRVLIEQLEAEEKTASGIILPDSAKEKPQQAKVLEVGAGKVVDGKRVPLEIKKGDKVLISSYGGDEIKIDGKELKIIKEEDVLAIIK